MLHTELDQVIVPVEKHRVVLLRDGELRPCADAAWFYRHPLPLARMIENWIIFGNGIEIIPLALMLPIERICARTPGSLMRFDAGPGADALTG